MNHTQILQYLIDTRGLSSYCEIGLQNSKNNFDKIKCKTKVSVDPDPNALAMYKCTSDDFFITNNRQFSIIFIDGLHTADQVKRDFENSLRCLNDNGFIVIHDTCPDEEKYTTVPRETRKWYGNVWMFAVSLNNYTGIDFVTLDIDCGITIVWKNGNEYKYSNSFSGCTFGYFQSEKNKLLNIIPPAEIDKHLP